MTQNLLCIKRRLNSLDSHLLYVDNSNFVDICTWIHSDYDVSELLYFVVLNYQPKLSFSDSGLVPVKLEKQHEAKS